VCVRDRQRSEEGEREIVNMGRRRSAGVKKSKVKQTGSREKEKCLGVMDPRNYISLR
jgi:hypothetical protein